MGYRFGKTIVVALGGSIIFPEDGIDWRFLKKFKSFVEGYVKEGRKFVIITGGGSICRVYQKAAAKAVFLRDEDKDWLGIHATRCNAHLLRTIFRGEADPVVFDSQHKRKSLRYPITIASGWRPGWSTDYVAVALAEDFRASEVVVAGKPDYVYDKDPHKYKNAEPFSEISWSEYRKLIPGKWVPGANLPVDPVASRLADNKGIKVIVMNGKDLKNFGGLLDGEDFRGTLIS